VALASRLFFWEDWGEGGAFLGLPKIVWNGNTLSFPGKPTLYRYQRRAVRDLVFSGGGVSDVNLHHQFDEVRIALENFEETQFEADLHAWWSWAARGQPYQVALDDSETADTTLDGSAAAGQKVIPLTSTTGITAGKKYLIRESAGEEEEIVEVASISAGVSVTALNNLKFGYLTGDIFRSRDYFPKMVSLDSDLPVQELITTFAFDHSCREDLG